MQILTKASFSPNEVLTVMKNYGHFQFTPDCPKYKLSNRQTESAINELVSRKLG